MSKYSIEQIFESTLVNTDPKIWGDMLAYDLNTGYDFGKQHKQTKYSVEVFSYSKLRDAFDYCGVEVTATFNNESKTVIFDASGLAKPSVAEEVLVNFWYTNEDQIESQKWEDLPIHRSWRF